MVERIPCFVCVNWNSSLMHVLQLWRRSILSQGRSLLTRSFQMLIWDTVLGQSFVGLILKCNIQLILIPLAEVFIVTALRWGGFAGARLVKWIFIISFGAFVSFSWVAFQLYIAFSIQSWTGSVWCSSNKIWMALGSKRSSYPRSWWQWSIWQLKATSCSSRLQLLEGILSWRLHFLPKFIKLDSGLIWLQFIELTFLGEEVRIDISTNLGDRSVKVWVTIFYPRSI